MLSSTDASSAFNALNKTAALHNIRMLCPIFAAYIINTYRQPGRLFIVGGKEIASAEHHKEIRWHGPLRDKHFTLDHVLQAASTAKQCWFADDASGAGPVTQIKDWWDALNILGPNLGYFPKSEKCWIIVKPEKEESVR